MRIRLERGVVGTVLLILVGCATGPSWAADIPLPQDLKVVAPEGSIPPEVAGFSGRWAGVWSSQTPHVLVVVKIHPADAKGLHKADVIYAWGVTNLDRRTVPGGFKEYKGTIRDGQLVVEGPMFNVVYQLSGDRRTLKGKWRGQTSFGSTDVDGTFKREPK